MPDQVRRPRLDRCLAQGDAGGAARRQSAGQKAQEDAQLGQGSIFDFGERAAAGTGAAQAAHQHRPPIPAAEFDRSTLLAMEKETLGTYLSSHPLAEVRDALRARVDCSIADLANKPDGSWVTVGGIVAACKKIRTKSGSQMMFATLDDVEGQVEMLVFKADQNENAAVIEPDAVVLVRGRLDHKERGETKLVVQEAERFEPDAEEIAKASSAAGAPAEPLRLKIDAANWHPGPARGAEGRLRAPQGRGGRPSRRSPRAKASRRSWCSATPTGCGTRAGSARSSATCWARTPWPPKTLVFRGARP